MVGQTTPTLARVSSDESSDVVADEADVPEIFQPLAFKGLNEGGAAPADLRNG